MQSSQRRATGSMSVTIPWMKAARGLEARIGSVMERYSTVPTEEAASIGVKRKKLRGLTTSRRYRSASTIFTRA